MTNSNKIEPIEVGFSDEDKVIFHLRRISVAESDEIDAKLLEADSSSEKHKRRFEIQREALGDYSIAMPEKYEKEKGELKRVSLTAAETASGAIESYFAERSITNEWIVRDAFLRFKQSLQPESRFLSFFE